MSRGWPDERGTVARLAMPFDTLKLARRLEGAGFPRQQARRHGRPPGYASDRPSQMKPGGIAEALSQLATKADLRDLDLVPSCIS
jgi:hypothetical protein